MQTNKEKIYDLVEKHFGLDKKSLDIFKSKLFDNKDIAPEYKKILGEETRKYFKIDDAIKEKLDEGWSTFKNVFSSFYEECDITYSDFRDNAFPYGGKKYRMLKALKAYYCDPTHAYRFFNDIRKNIMHIDSSEIKKLFFGERSVLVSSVASISYENDKYVIKYKNKIGRTITLTKNVLTSKFENFFNNNEKLIEEYFERASERIGAERFPNKDIFLVLSVDYEDWFLCSTGEKWSSCLSLESAHSGAFWAGLPGTITDKNRALVYITDKTQKNYSGITVDHIITRSWLLAGKDNHIYFVNTYPSRMNLQNIIADTFLKGIKDSEDFISGKYEFEPLFTEHGSEKHLLYIYEDSSSIQLRKKKNDIVAILGGGRGKTDWVVTESFGSISITECGDDLYDYSGGLGKLIKKNESISKYFYACGCDEDE